MQNNVYIVVVTNRIQAMDHQRAHEGTAKDAASSRASQPQSKDVVDVNRFDVLLGRGTGPNEHPGNRTFRHLKLMKEYNEATSRVETGEVLLRVIDTVTRVGPRCLPALLRSLRLP